MAERDGLDEETLHYNTAEQLWGGYWIVSFLFCKKNKIMVFALEPVKQYLEQ